METSNVNRRNFLSLGCMSLTGLALSKNAYSDQNSRKQEKKEEEEVSPVEDLMREHGVLNRILLIYDENLRIINSGKTAHLTQLQKAAKIIRNFVEDYHEKLEEDFIFPKFEKAKREVELVKVLREQHKAGRALTDVIVKAGKGSDLADVLQKFITMYRPHEAREDTVLFPQLRKLVSENEYKELGEKFEDKEHALFGKAGFSGIVDEVATIEKALGIYDLSRFTPQLK